MSDEVTDMPTKTRRIKKTTERRRARRARVGSLSSAQAQLTTTAQAAGVRLRGAWADVVAAVTTAQANLEEQVRQLLKRNRIGTRDAAAVMKDVRALAEQVRASGRVLQVGHNRRFDPGLTFARQVIEEQLGQRLALKFWYCDSTERYTMTDNLQPLPLASAGARRP